MNEIRGEISAMMRQPNQGDAIDGSVSRRVDPAAVGVESAANSVDAVDNDAAEAAAAASAAALSSSSAALAVDAAPTAAGLIRLAADPEIAAP